MGILFIMSDLKKTSVLGSAQNDLAQYVRVPTKFGVGTNL